MDEQLLGKIAIIKDMDGPFKGNQVDVFPPGTIGRVIRDDNKTHLLIAANLEDGPKPFKTTHQEAWVHREQIEIVSNPPLPDHVIERLCGIITDLRFQLEQSKARHQAAMEIIEKKREEIYVLKEQLPIGDVEIFHDRQDAWIGEDKDKEK